MTPSSDKNSSSDFQHKDDLLKVIGNPATTETEWLSACEKLGDHQQLKARKNGELKAAAVGIAVFATLIGGGVSLSFINHLKQTPAPVAHAPVPNPVAADVDFGPYVADLQRRIKRAWFPPKGSESKRVVSRFKVHSNGALTDVKIYKSSGVPACDAAALKAVENAAPFKAMPSGASENVDIEFTFDYNVFKQHSASR